MKFLRAQWKGVLLGAGTVVVAVLAVTLTFLFFRWTAAPTDILQNVTSAVNASTSITTVTSTAPIASAAVPVPHPSGGGTPSIPALPGPAITIHLLNPGANETWTIGQSNSIAWDNPANVTGEIDLLNSNTGAVVGIILSETGPNQTSYSWNGRSIYLSRYGADEKDVVPGKYSIRIHFDGNGLGNLISNPVIISD